MEKEENVLMGEALTIRLDDALWFTEFRGNNIGRITLRGRITEFAVPTAQSDPTFITRGPGNTLGFTEQGANKVGLATING